MADQSKVEQFRTQLRVIVANLPETPDLSALAPRRLKSLKKEVESAIHRFQVLSAEIDPVRQPRRVFDPADPKVIGEMIAKTLLIEPAQPLNGMDRAKFKFYGSGVYALYYHGSFPAYAPISGTDHPIYVGKADPKKVNARTVEEQGVKLSERLDKHRKNIAATRNLNIEDFSCRYLVVKSAWQKTVEDYLISWFKPIWNKETKICKGFGKHGDRASTRANRRSPWDTLHPGRKWATTDDNVPNEKSEEQILREISEHFSMNPPVKQISDLSSGTK